MSNIQVQSPEILKRNLSKSTGSSLIGFQRGLTSTILRNVDDVMKEEVSVFDYIPATEHAAILNATSTYDCTGDVNSAIFECKDFYSLKIPAGRFNVSNLITYPTTSMIGAGRHRTNFWCLPGTVGKMISDAGNGAQKLVMGDMAFYGNNEIGLTHVGEFGNLGVQYGTAGNLFRLWFRTAIYSTGLSLNGNVGVITDIDVIDVKDGLLMSGASNVVINLSVAAFSGTGYRMSSGYSTNIEIEAPATGAVPISFFRAGRIDGCTISLTAGTSFVNLIEVDPSVGDQWAVDGLRVVGGGTYGSVFGQGTTAWNGVNCSNSGLQYVKKQTVDDILTTKKIIVGSGADAIAVQGIFKKVATLDFPPIATGSRAMLTVSVTGAQPNMPVIMGLPSSGTTIGIYFQAWVSALNTVTIGAYNLLGTSIDPISQTFVITVLDYA